jgi:hypothetical protein
MMKKLFKEINWKYFIRLQIYMLMFLISMYFAGNNKFPIGIWRIPVFLIILDIIILLRVYIFQKKGV